MNHATTTTAVNVLSESWQDLLAAMKVRQDELKRAHEEAEEFQQHIQEKIRWLVETVEPALDKDAGYDKITEPGPQIMDLLNKGKEYLERATNPQGNQTATTLQGQMRTLQAKWDAMIAKATIKKDKVAEKEKQYEKKIQEIEEMKKKDLVDMENLQDFLAKNRPSDAAAASANDDGARTEDDPATDTSSV